MRRRRVGCMLGATRLASCDVHRDVSVDEVIRRMRWCGVSRLREFIRRGALCAVGRTWWELQLSER